MQPTLWAGRASAGYLICALNSGPCCAPQSEAHPRTEKYEKRQAKAENPDGLESLKFKMLTSEDKRARECGLDRLGAEVQVKSSATGRMGGSVDVKQCLCERRKRVERARWIRPSA